MEVLGFVYVQKTGEIAVSNLDFDCPIAVGSAGRAEGRNNPRMQSVRNTGPLPCGRYRMEVVPHRKFAAPAIKLTQIEGETFGRSGFFIHGGTTSEGCILLQKEVRRAIAALIAIGFAELLVIEQ